MHSEEVQFPRLQDLTVQHTRNALMPAVSVLIAAQWKSKLSAPSLLSQPLFVPQSQKSSCLPFEHVLK